MQELLKKVEESSLREEPLQFEIGDTVDVHTRIQEGNKERIQVFSGVVIAVSWLVKGLNVFFPLILPKSPSWMSNATVVSVAPSCTT